MINYFRNSYSSSILLAVLILWPNIGQAACSKSIVIAYNDWIPYTYTLADGEVVGLDVDIINEVMQVAGCQYTFAKMPSKRAFRELSNGSVDMLRGASVTEERKKMGWFTIPYRKEKIGLMVRKGEQANFPLSSLSSIINKNITVSAGQSGWYGPEYSKLLKNEQFLNQLILTVNTEQRIRMLVQKRFDMVIGDPVSMIYSARQTGNERNVEIHPLDLYDGEVNFLLGKAGLTKLDLETLNAALTSIKKDGSLQKIIDRYFLTH